MIKKILSYFITIKIHTVNSAISKSIEVTWSNGELVMDSENANYSYGSLQRILKLGLKTIGFNKITAMDHVLVLGVAGGSVIKTLVNEIKFKGRITGVEIDPDIITIANQYFKLNQIKQLEIVIDDAFEFVFKTKEKYDLIIIDVFQDTTMPNFLFEAFFTDQICLLLKSKGVVLFNTMLLNEKHNNRNYKYIEGFNDVDYLVKSIPRVERHNELIVIEKKH
jgi:spermidine synthase